MRSNFVFGKRFEVRSASMIVFALLWVFIGTACSDFPPVRPEHRGIDPANAAVETSDRMMSEASGDGGAGAVMQGPGGILMVYEFRGPEEMLRGNLCRVKLQNLRTHEDIFVSLRKDQNAIFMELQPGRYIGKRLSCSTFKIWNLESLFGLGFEVRADHVSYLGKVVFEFSKSDLKSFRQAPRLEGQAAVANHLSLVPNGMRHSVISGYTLRPITQEVMMAEGPEAFDLFVKGSNEPNKTLESLINKLRRCGEIASKNDPLRIGHVNYLARYKQNKFAEMLASSGDHAFSEMFTTCIDNSLRAFQPPLSSDLEVQVRF